MKEIHAIDGVKVSRNTVSRCIKRYRETGNLAPKPRPGRKPILATEHLDFIDSEVEKNDELTSAAKLCKSQILRNNSKLGFFPNIRVPVGILKTNPKNTFQFSISSDIGTPKIQVLALLRLIFLVIGKDCNRSKIPENIDQFEGGGGT